MWNTLLFIFDAYRTYGIIYVYSELVGFGVDGWFVDDEEEDDNHESCIDGENRDNIDELRNGNVEFNEDVMTKFGIQVSMVQNLQKRFSGAIYHTLFWRASKDITENAFKVVMKEIETLTQMPINISLKKIQKMNGLSESFNDVIVDARKKPIITIFEELRLYMMDRLYNMRLKGQKWGNHICPEISDKVNFLKKVERHYHVRGVIDAYQVDLERKTCSYRLWKLNGYVSTHSIASISYLKRDVEAYVDNMYNTTTFRKAYNYRIAPMNGRCLVGQLLVGTNPLQRIKETQGFQGRKENQMQYIQGDRSQQGYLSTKKTLSFKCEEKEETKNLSKEKSNLVIYSSTSEPQQHDEVELSQIQVDTTQNYFQATPNYFESSGAGGYRQYMQVTPPRSYEAEGFVGNDDEVENVEGGQSQSNVEFENGQANLEVENVEGGKGQGNGVVEDGQGLVNVVVEEAVEVPNLKNNFKDIEEDNEKKVGENIKDQIRKDGQMVGGVDDLGNCRAIA
uniref:Uncharacterized protein n=1 Tax=Lactuca sativa TaxID=4236 RepID=A0A9R1V0L6_LACSA|nr:hypothetical protein LSAT_V11C700373310 [Lactuca sativa]